MGKSNQGAQKSGKGAAKVKAYIKSAAEHLKEKIEQGLIVKHPIFVVVKCVSAHVEQQYRTVLAKDLKNGSITIDGRTHFRVITVEPTKDAATLRRYCEGKNRFRGVRIDPQEAVREQANAGSILAAMAIMNAKMDEVQTGEPSHLME